MRLLYAVLLAGVAVPPLGRWFGAKGNPRAGTWLLAAVCVVVAAASLWALVLLSGTLLEDLLGARSAEGREPVSDPEALLSLGLLTMALVRMAGGAKARWRLRRALRHACAGSPSRLVIVAAEEAYAFAVPGPVFRRDEWRILVSQGMLRVLNRRQRRVLLAHERAHLRLGHHRFRLITQVAAAINPLLTKADAAMVFLCERWADEKAAAEVGDRRLTARSLGAAALAGSSVTTGAAAFHEHDVTRRVRALLQPPAGVLPIACLIALVLMTMSITEDFSATEQLAGYLKTFLPF